MPQIVIFEVKKDIQKKVCQNKKYQTSKTWGRLRSELTSEVAVTLKGYRGSWQI